MERNIINSRFLNSRAFQLLSEKTKSTEDFEIIEDVVTSCANYVSDVDIGETQIRRFYATLEGDELREKVMAVDHRRRSHHEEAIINCKMINRLAAANGIEDVFTGNVEDRLQVADFCLDVVVDIFQKRQK